MFIMEQKIDEVLKELKSMSGEFSGVKQAVEKLESLFPRTQSLEKKMEQYNTKIAK